MAIENSFLIWKGMTIYGMTCIPQRRMVWLSVEYFLGQHSSILVFWTKSYNEDIVVSCEQDILLEGVIFLREYACLWIIVKFRLEYWWELLTITISP